MSTAPDMQPAVIAENLAITGELGPVYGPVSFTIPRKGLTLLCGKGGSGRTALALTIAGRMKPQQGQLTVLGHTKPKHIQPLVAIAGFSAIDLLERDLTVGQVLKEHLSWQRNPFAWQGKVSDDEAAPLLAPVYGDEIPLPQVKQYISELTDLQRVLLRIALAVDPASKKRVQPQLLVVDDLEQIRHPLQQKVLLARLAALAQDLPVVVTTVLPHEEQPNTLINLA